MIIAQSKSIRQCGHDELWLQNMICENPQLLSGMLNANELRLVGRERRQSSGGRLDILLQDPESETMYEVEVMLGETDESHIVRTIEYWDIEKKRWPRRSHVAVLISERINSRFYNVINLLSHALPILGIQVNIVSVEGVDALHFTKIIDTYEEPEIETAGDEVITEEVWRREMPEQLSCVEIIRAILIELGRTDHSVVFHKNYVAIGMHGKHRIWISMRSHGKVSIELLIPDESMSECEELISPIAVDVKRRPTGFRWMTNHKEITEHRPLYLKALDLLLPSPIHKTD